jgi:hypothetical protein
MRRGDKSGLREGGVRGTPGDGIPGDAFLRARRPRRQLSLEFAEAARSAQHSTGPRAWHRAVGCGLCGAADHIAPGSGSPFGKAHSVRPAVSERGDPASRTADLTVALCDLSGPSWGAAPLFEPFSRRRVAVAALRRFRIPVPACVTVRDGRPERVATDRRGLGGGRVEIAAGPWRTSGEWWLVPDARLQAVARGSRPQVGWNRDEWDVALVDGAIYRIYRDRDRDRWFVDGIVD